jgi:hypothetical protein
MLLLCYTLFASGASPLRHGTASGAVNAPRGKYLEGKEAESKASCLALLARRAFKGAQADMWKDGSEGNESKPVWETWSVMQSAGNGRTKEAIVSIRWG